jgi:hypothetical protein
MGRMISAYARNQNRGTPMRPVPPRGTPMRPTSGPQYSGGTPRPPARPAPAAKAEAVYGPKTPSKPPTKKRRPRVTPPKDIGFQVEAGVRRGLGMR